MMDEKYLAPLKPKVICEDGFEMSVQNNWDHHCDEWSSEVGFPSKIEELLMPYIYNPDKPTRTIYTYVPNEVIEKIIEKHGGRKKLI